MCSKTVIKNYFGIRYQYRGSINVVKVAENRPSFHYLRPEDLYFTIVTHIITLQVCCLTVDVQCYRVLYLACYSKKKIDDGIRMMFFDLCSLL